MNHSKTKVTKAVLLTIKIISGCLLINLNKKKFNIKQPKMTWTATKGKYKEKGKMITNIHCETKANNLDSLKYGRQ